MRKTLICSLIGLVGCTWMAGCQDKPDGAQTIIIELADPSDQVEETKEELSDESISESDTEMETGETQSEEMPEIIGFEENVEFAYKQVSSNDPIIGLLLENVIPDVQVKDFEITDAQAYQNGERVTPTGEITFTLNVEPDASVILYRLNADGELVSEALEVTDGAVSYESTGCGRWLILDTLLEQETESVSELAREEERISKRKAAEMFESGMLDEMIPGSYRALQAIHNQLFCDVYEFAGQTRTVNIAKGNFRFAPVMYLDAALKNVEKMPQSTFDEIVEKYVEMNIAHPFREGNGRSTRIWLDQILKKELGKVVDWSKVDKDDYLMAMERSPIKDIEIKVILQKALTDQIDDREMFMKGVDHSYEYEGYHSYRTEDLIKNTRNKSKKTVSKNVIEKQEEEEQDEEIER